MKWCYKVWQTYGERDARGVIEADQPNFFEKVFPCLFPCGSIEVDREVAVDFWEHVWWALQYFDHWFQKHQTFPFVAFSISQQQQALGSAWVQMQRKNFNCDACIMSTIMMEKLELAQQEEEKHLLISDPAVHLLKSHINATAGCIMGSDQSCFQLCSQIWSTSIYLGPPYLWITISPSDIHVCKMHCSIEMYKMLHKVLYHIFNNI